MAVAVLGQSFGALKIGESAFVSPSRNRCLGQFANLFQVSRRRWENQAIFGHAISHEWIVGALELNPNFFAKLAIARDVSAGYEQRGEHVIRDMVGKLKAQCPGSISGSLFPPASPGKEIASIAQETGALGLG